MSSIVLDRRGVRQAQIRGAAAAPANRAAESWRALRAVWASARLADGPWGATKANHSFHTIWL